MDKEEYYIDNDTPKFLCCAPNDIEAGRIGSLLKSYEIPVMFKRSESGGVASILMGMSLTGVDLYVPSKLFEAAGDIISDVKGESDGDEPDWEPDEREPDDDETP